MIEPKITIKAVDDESLPRILRKLGVYDDLVNGRIECFFCGKTLSLDDVGGMFLGDDGRVKLVCGSMKCLYKAAEYTARRRRARRGGAG